MRGDHGFQSTLPARGATSYRTKVMLGRKFQSTLPARGATRRFPSLRTRRGISIHAPRTGSDLALRVLQILHELFQSTLPARGATKEKNQFAATYSISIHAPRTGSDVAQQFSIYFKNHFNPRSPHGERLRPSVRRIPACHFNPRSPHGERLKPYSANAKRIQFQSTLPARGATAGTRTQTGISLDFNPRSPHGERQQRLKVLMEANIFQSTLPARGATIDWREILRPQK